MLVHLFRLFPSYQVGNGLINLSTLYLTNQLSGTNVSPFSPDCVGDSLRFLAGEFGVFLLLVLVLDSDMADKLNNDLGKLLDRVTGLKGAEQRLNDRGRDEEEVRGDCVTPLSRCVGHRWRQ